MLPFAAAAAAGRGDPAMRPVSSFSRLSGTSAALSTIKALPGDFALFASPNTPSPTSGSGTGTAGGWSAYFSGGGLYTCYKRLTEADVAAGVSGADFVLGIWRGAANQAALVAHASGNPSATTTDVVKGANHLGFAALTYDTHTYSPVTVSGFAQRGSYTNSGSGYRVALFDRLAPPNAAFADHDPITASVALYNISLDIIEFRRV